MWRWLCGSFVAVGILTLLIAGCTSKQAPKSTPANAVRVLDEKGIAEAGLPKTSGLDAIKKRGTLRILVDGFDPPFRTWREGDTRVEGFTIDVAQRITEIIFAGKVKAEFFPELEKTKGYNPLHTSEVDIQFTRRTIEIGNSHLRYSPPYYTDSARFLVREDQRISSVKDLAGKLIGYSLFVDTRTPDPAQSVQLKQAQATAGFNLQKYHYTELVIDAVVERKVAAVLLPTSEAAWRMQQKKDAGLVVLPDRYDSWSYGAIMREENTELADAVDKAIAQMKSSGELDQLIKKWGMDI